MSRFSSFVLFAEMRTGSNHVEASLNALDGVDCLGEVFNPHFLGQHNRFELEGIDMAARDADPLVLLDRLRARPGLTGFRLFHDHDPRVVDAILPDASVGKILLGRNPVDAYVSFKIAQATGQWKLTNPKMAKAATATFDSAEFDAMVEAQRAFRAKISRVLQITGQSAFWLDYEEIGDLEVINGLAAFLGVPARLDSLPGKLKRQNPGETTDKVTNPDAMVAHLAQLDAFSLSRLPGVELPRGPGVPQMMAAGDVLVLPIPGGPTAALRTWLGGVGEISDSFNQRSLRQWLRRHKGMQAITIVQHPLVRAHAAFVDLLSRNSDVRRLLVRHYQAAIPEKGPIDWDSALHRAVFEAFLRFAKANIGGQTALPPDLRWGHQLVALQGMAQVVLPTRILREEEAPEALAPLSPPGAPPFEAPKADPLLRLDAIHDRDLEDQVREIWRRDYLTFGFRRWAR